MTKYQTKTDNKLRQMAAKLRAAGMISKYIINKVHQTCVMKNVGSRPVTLCNQESLFNLFQDEERNSAKTLVFGEEEDDNDDNNDSGMA